MADETRDDRWGDQVAWWTFVVTIASAVLFVAAAVFIMSARGGP